MKSNRPIHLSSGMIALSLILFSTSAEAQRAYASANGRCDIHNACWQALRIPFSTEAATGPIAAQLEACKSAGGPDAYFGRRVDGMRLCRIVNGTITLE